MIDWQPNVLADGLKFPEGPMAVGEGVVIFTEIEGQRLARYENGRVEKLTNT